MNLKDQLKLFMTEFGYSAARIAKNTGIATSTLNDWLSGVNPRDIKKVKAVADLFDVSVDHLCFGKGLEEVRKLKDIKSEIQLGIFEVYLKKVRKS